MVNCTAAILLSWFRVFVYLVSWFLVFSLLPWLPCDFVYLGLLTYPCASVPCVTLSTPHLIQFISFISLVIVCFDFTCPLLYLTNYILILLFRLVPVRLLFCHKKCPFVIFTCFVSCTWLQLYSCSVAPTQTSKSPLWSSSGSPPDGLLGG